MTARVDPLNVACGTCGAPAEKPCVDLTNEWRPYPRGHRRRHETARQEQERHDVG
jgi:hypothetical protein